MDFAPRSQIPTRAPTPPPPTRRAGELTSLSHLEVARHVPVALSVVVPVGGLGPCHAQAALRVDFDSTSARRDGAPVRAPPPPLQPRRRARPAPGADLLSCRAERRACSAGFRPDMPTDERPARVGRAPRFGCASPPSRSSARSPARASQLAAGLPITSEERSCSAHDEPAPCGRVEPAASRAIEALIAQITASNP